MPQVVKTTTSGEVSDENFVKMMTFSFQFDNIGTSVLCGTSQQTGEFDIYVILHETENCSPG